MSDQSIFDYAMFVAVYVNGVVIPDADDPEAAASLTKGGQLSIYDDASGETVVVTADATGLVTVGTESGNRYYGTLDISLQAGHVPLSEIGTQIWSQDIGSATYNEGEASRTVPTVSATLRLDTVSELPVAVADDGTCIPDTTARLTGGAGATGVNAYTIYGMNAEWASP